MNELAHVPRNSTLLDGTIRHGAAVDLHGTSVAHPERSRPAVAVPVGSRTERPTPHCDSTAGAGCNCPLIVERCRRSIGQVEGRPAGGSGGNFPACTVPRLTKSEIVTLWVNPGESSMTDPLLVKVPTRVKRHRHRRTRSSRRSATRPTRSVDRRRPIQRRSSQCCRRSWWQFPVSVSGSNPPIWSTPPIDASTVYVTPKSVLTQVSVPGVPAAPAGTGRPTWCAEHDAEQKDRSSNVGSAKPSHRTHRFPP